MRWGFILYVASSTLGATAPRECLTVVIEGTLFGTLTGSETCHEPDVNLTTQVSTGQSNLSCSSMAKGCVSCLIGARSDWLGEDLGSGCP
jgi:hypothetical protein